MASPTKPARPGRKATRPSHRPTAHTPGDYGEAFPNSKKIYVEGPQGIRVPMREIALSGGEPPFQVYDTSGPQGHDVREGLPPVRGEWIAARAVTSHESRVARHTFPTGLLPRAPVSRSQGGPASYAPK